jgi:hypothetical protein
LSVAVSEKYLFKFKTLSGKSSTLVALKQGADLNIPPHLKMLAICAQRLEQSSLVALVFITASTRKAGLIVGMIRTFGTNHCGGRYDKSNPVLQERWSRSDGVR